MELFSLHYLPQVKQFGALINADEIAFDTGEHYQRQTYRNRAEIYTADGLHKLIIPVVKNESGVHRSMKEMKISYDHDWRTIHLRTIKSAYQSSAYYEFFEEEFVEIYKPQFNFLVDFNLNALDQVFKMMKLSFSYKLISEYERTPVGMTDRREEFSLNDHRLGFEYHQVFQQRKGFIGNLSCIDFLFNAGPKKMISELKNTIKN
jgi:hypothetical protein